MTGRAHLSSSSGFGLVELLAAVAVTGLITASLGTVLNQTVSADAKVENLHADMRAIDAAQRAFAAVLTHAQDTGRSAGSGMIDGRGARVALSSQGPGLLDARTPRQFEMAAEPGREGSLDLRLGSLLTPDAASRGPSFGAFKEIEMRYLVLRTDLTAHWMSEWRGPTRRLAAIKLRLTGAKASLSLTRVHLVRPIAAPACFESDELPCKGLD